MGNQCSALTRKGNQCPNDAPEDSGLCHVHDPLLQCGWQNARGKRCRIPTGGGRCKHHTHEALTGRKPRRRKAKATPTVRAAFDARVAGALADLDAISRY